MVIPFRADTETTNLALTPRKDFDCGMEWSVRAAVHAWTLGYYSGCIEFPMSRLFAAFSGRSTCPLHFHTFHFVLPGHQYANRGENVLNSFFEVITVRNWSDDTIKDHEYTRLR